MEKKKPISATEFWQSKFDEKPQNDSEKLAVAMMAEYENYYSQFKTSAPIKEVSDEEIELILRRVYNAANSRHPDSDMTINKYSKEIRSLFSSHQNKEEEEIHPDGWVDKDGHSFLNRKDTPYSAEAMKSGYKPFYFSPPKQEATDIDFNDALKTVVK